MILLHIPEAKGYTKEKQEFRDKIKKEFGVRWNRDLINPVTNTKGCWCISGDKAAGIPSKWLISQEINFADFLMNAGKQVQVPNLLYTFKADVHDVYCGPNEAFYMYTLFTEHNLKRTIKVKVPFNLLEDKHYKEFIDKEVEVTGRVFVYKPYLTFQIEAISFKLVGPCTRLKELEKWQSVCDELVTKKVANNDPWPDGIQKVGLIANMNSSGYVDFIDEITKHNVILSENIITKNVTMKLEDIVNALQELNKESNCDVICIVRGGGDPETLIDYSRPEFLEAIVNSKIPVVTGIGHSTDNLLCKQVAFHASKTPTAAANYINTQVYKKKKEKRGEQQAKFFNQQLEKRERAAINWKERCLNAEKKIEELEKEISALNTQIAKLSQKKAEITSEKQPEPKKQNWFSKLFK